MSKLSEWIANRLFGKRGKAMESTVTGVLNPILDSALEHNHIPTTLPEVEQKLGVPTPVSDVINTLE